MAGRWTSSEKQLRPDPRYADKTLSKFINCVMKEGKKAVAQRCVYDAMTEIKDRLSKETNPDAPKSELELFHMAIENVKPFVEVRSKRIGGANYQVPMQVNKRRQQSLAFRWILEVARGSRRGRPFTVSLAEELVAAFKREGGAFTKRENVHKMAEANKAFSHFRF